MTWEVFVSLFRQLLVVAGTYVASSGFLTADQWQMFSGAAITIVTTCYMVWARWNTVKVAAK